MYTYTVSNQSSLSDATYGVKAAAEPACRRAVILLLRVTKAGEVGKICVSKYGIIVCQQSWALILLKFKINELASWVSSFVDNESLPVQSARVSSRSRAAYHGRRSSIIRILQQFMKYRTASWVVPTDILKGSCQALNLSVMTDRLKCHRDALRYLSSCERRVFNPANLRGVVTHKQGPVLLRQVITLAKDVRLMPCARGLVA